MGFEDNRGSGQRFVTPAKSEHGAISDGDDWLKVCVFPLGRNGT